MITPNTFCSLEECKKPIHKKPNILAKQSVHYCSREHFAIARTQATKITVVTCVNCNKNFRRRKPSQKFCSHACSNEARRGIAYDGSALFDKEGRRRKNYRLLKDLFGEFCAMEGCPVSSNWNGQPLVLHVDHINGDNSDNVITNLRFLCPNCHTQTPTYAGRNKAFQKKRLESLLENN